MTILSKIAVVAVGMAMATSFAAAQTISSADLVREARFGDPGSTNADRSQYYGTAATISPNGRYAFVIERHGDVDGGRNIGILRIYTTKSARLRQPIATLFLGSTTNYQPISNVRWLADSSGVGLLGADGETDPQVYIFGIDGTSRRIRSERPVSWFAVSADETKVLTQGAPEATNPESDRTCIEAGCRVTADTLYGAQHGIRSGTGSLNLYDLPSDRATAIPAPESKLVHVEECPRVPASISPTADRALIICSVNEASIPGHWRQHPGVRELLNRTSLTGEKIYTAQTMWGLGALVVINLADGGITQLNQEPFLDQSRVALLDSGRYAIVEPIATCTSDDNRSCAIRGFAMMLRDTNNGETLLRREIPRSISRVLGLRWDSLQNELIVSGADSAGKTIELHFREKSKWAVRAIGDATASGVACLDRHTCFRIRQSLNDPQVLLIEDKAGQNARVLLDPNAWIRTRALGRTKAISWRLKDGRSWSGGITYPPNYSPSVRYPLVIQTHGFLRDQFGLDGAVSKNYPGQALAAEGVVVLQVADFADGKYGVFEAGVSEWTSFQAAIEAAIDHLADAKIIDRSKVGIIGYSRSGMQVAYLLAHTSYPFKAVAYGDTGGFGISTYLQSSNSTKREFDSIYGPNTSPLTAQGIGAWIRHSPGFRFDQIKTPTIMWEDGAVAALWDWYSALRYFNIPVEYWYYPRGAHNLYAIRQRVPAIERTVDWFLFWLVDKEREGGDKQGQYLRWRELREHTRISTPSAN